MKKALLIAGMGWARIPKYMIEHELAGGQLVLIEIENFASQGQVPIFLIRARRQPLSSLADCFWKFVQVGL